MESSQKSIGHEMSDQFQYFFSSLIQREIITKKNKKIKKKERKEKRKKKEKEKENRTKIEQK
jgi:hypothetical protein